MAANVDFFFFLNKRVLQVRTHISSRKKGWR